MVCPQEAEEGFREAVGFWEGHCRCLGSLGTNTRMDSHPEKQAVVLPVFTQRPQAESEFFLTFAISLIVRFLG